MVQVVKNRSLLDCRLVRIVPTAGWTEAQVVVEGSDDVAAVPNLIRPSDAPVVLRLKDYTALPSRFRIEAWLTAPGVIWADATTVAPLP